MRLQAAADGRPVGDSDLAFQRQGDDRAPTCRRLAMDVQERDDQVLAVVQPLAVDAHVADG